MKRWIIRRVIDRIGVMNIVAVVMTLLLIGGYLGVCMAALYYE